MKRSCILAITLSAALAGGLVPAAAFAADPATPSGSAPAADAPSSVTAPAVTVKPVAAKVFKLTPKKTSVKTLKAGKKSFTVTWKKKVTKAASTTGTARLAVSGGHSPVVGGAKGIIDEVTENRKVSNALIKTLRSMGYTVTNCSNAKPTSAQELAEECRIANKSGSDLYVTIHFNAKDNRQDTGVEAFYYRGSARGKTFAANISRELSGALGLKNQGAKVHWNNLKVLRDTNMTGVLVEVCYVDNPTDVAAYQRLGADNVGTVIANAIASTKAKTAQSYGYQIRYSTNKKFTSGVKTVTVKSGSTVKKTIKGLKAKKRYYVQVRPWTKVNDRTYYGSWSATKSVKTK